jgi:DNA-binding IscR family transcriptional regulator
MPGLTVGQRAALNGVIAHYALHGRPPSYKELAARLGTDPAVVHRHVARLARAKLVEVKVLRGRRSEIRLTDPVAELSSADLVRILSMRGHVVQLGGDCTLCMAGRAGPQAEAPRSPSKVNTPTTI